MTAAVEIPATETKDTTTPDVRDEQRRFDEYLSEALNPYQAVAGSTGER